MENPFSPIVFTFGSSSPGSDDASPCTGSSADIPASGVAVPLILSLLPPLSPEEFERLWLQQHAVRAEQGINQKLHFREWNGLWQL